jgi:hypothetical protein
MAPPTHRSRDADGMGCWDVSARSDPCSGQPWVARVGILPQLSRASYLFIGLVIDARVYGHRYCISRCSALVRTGLIVMHRV